jgi:hypothetical protein
MIRKLMRGTQKVRDREDAFANTRDACAPRADRAARSFDRNAFTRMNPMASV